MCLLISLPIHLSWFYLRRMPSYFTFWAFQSHIYHSILHILLASNSINSDFFKFHNFAQIDLWTSWIIAEWRSSVCTPKMYVPLTEIAASTSICHFFDFLCLLHFDFWQFCFANIKQISAAFYLSNTHNFSVFQDGIFLAKTLLKLKNEHSIKRSNYLTLFSARLTDGILKHFILLLDKFVSAISTFLNDADAGRVWIIWR